MNRAIAEIFGVLNALAAIAIILSGTFLGQTLWGAYTYTSVNHSIHVSLGLIVSLLASVFVAVILCGPMALLIAMLGELTRIRQEQAREGARQPPEPRLRAIAGHARELS